jgi:hypothetical protein
LTSAPVLADFNFDVDPLIMLGQLDSLPRVFNEDRAVRRYGRRSPRSRNANADTDHVDLVHGCAPDHEAMAVAALSGWSEAHTAKPSTNAMIEFIDERGWIVSTVSTGDGYCCYIRQLWGVKGSAMLQVTLGQALRPSSAKSTVGLVLLAVMPRPAHSESQDLGQTDEPERGGAVGGVGQQYAADWLRNKVDHLAGALIEHGAVCRSDTQAVRDREAARPPRVAVALHSDPCRRRPDLGDPRE